MIRPTQDFAKFLESLKVKNEGAEKMHGFMIFAPIDRLRRNNAFNRDLFKGDKNVLHFCDLVDVLLTRIEHLESNAKPETLAEDVKGFMRAGMDAGFRLGQCDAIAHTMGIDGAFVNGKTLTESKDRYHEFRRLSEPDKQGEG